MAKAPAGTLYRGREGMWSWVAHRITGVLIFFFLLVHVLDTALVRVSPEAYNAVIGTYKNPIVGLGEAGLVADRSYFDRTPYVELDADGTVLYAEHHRTLGDRVADLAAAGLVLERLVEPEWPERADHVWGGWSALRGRLLPGTLILAARRP